MPRGTMTTTRSKTGMVHWVDLWKNSYPPVWRFHESYSPSTFPKTIQNIIQKSTDFIRWSYSPTINWSKNHPKIHPLNSALELFSVWRRTWLFQSEKSAKLEPWLKAVHCPLNGWLNWRRGFSTTRIPWSKYSCLVKLMWSTDTFW